MSTLNGAIIFGDGACSGNPGPGGWGAIVFNPETGVQEMGGYQSATTNNQMEMIAVITALESLKGFKDTIHIYTDSSYLLNGITQWVFGWKKRGWKTADGKDVANSDLWGQFLSVVGGFQKKQIIWGYVPGHEGVPGNERVDKIAVAFSKKEHVNLYKGSLSNYGVDLEKVPEDTSIPEMNFEKREKKVAHSYLSLIGGVPERHKTWSECEARVKGRSGAKFKKAMSESEESLILKEWGIEPSKLKR